MLRRWIYLLLVVGLLVAAGRQTKRLARERQEKRLNSRTSTAGVPPAYALADGLLGGFRGFLISTLWQRAQEKKENRQFYEMTDIYKIISTLEPNYPNAWANMAWDLSYNVAAEFDGDPHERLYWIFRGISLLRDEGIRHNPHSALLYDQLSWIYFNKMANSVDPAYPLYRQALAAEVMAVLDGPGELPLLESIVAARRRQGGLEKFLATPEVRRLAEELRPLGVENLAADAYLIVRDKKTVFADILRQMPKLAILKDVALLNMGVELQKRLNVEVDILLEISRKFPAIDWRLPQAQSLYWAWCGRQVMLRNNPQYDDLKFERMIYFSLIQLAHGGSGMVTESGMVIATPNPPMVDGIVRYMEKLLASRKDSGSVVGIRSGFAYFMETTVFNYYFADNLLQAEKIRQKLCDFTGDKRKYGVSLTQFVNQQLPEFISGLTERESTMLLVSFCNRAYRYLIAGNPRQFQEQMAWFDSNYQKLFNDWRQRFEGTFNWRQQYGMPSPEELKAQLAAQILAGRTQYSEREIAAFRKAMQKFLPQILGHAEKIVAGSQPPPAKS